MEMNKHEYYKDKNGFIFRVTSTKVQDGTASIAVLYDDYIYPEKNKISNIKLGNERVMNIGYNSYNNDYTRLTYEQVRLEKKKALKKMLTDLINNPNNAISTTMNLFYNYDIKKLLKTVAESLSTED